MNLVLRSYSSEKNQEHDDLLNELVGKTFGSWTVLAFVGKNTIVVLGYADADAGANGHF
jgi:hypothetical protein